MPSPIVYLEGHVKHNAEQNLVALRTIFDEHALVGNQAWIVSTPNQGAFFLKTADVESWDDLFVPEPPPAPPAE